MLVLAAGCLEAPLVPCGELYCAPGSVCAGGGCAAPADVAACDGLPDAEACRAANGGAGTCESGVCHTGLCGNGVLDVGEACDDGNQISGDGCRGDCLKIEICGDGVLDVGEACDDGNHNPADGCDNCMRTTWTASTVVGTEIDATLTALADPHGIAIDGLGRMFIADTDNHRVLRVETDGSLTKVAGTGTAGYAGDGGVATSAELSFPAAVAVDGIGRVFVVDTQNARIRRVETDGTITTIAGTGVAGFSGDGGPALLAQLANPNGIAVDGLGRVVIADTDNNRIRQIDIDGTITTLAGTGTAGFTGDGADATLAELSGPYGVAIDDSGRVIVTDTGSSAVRRIGTDGVIATLAGNGSDGFGGDGGPAVAAQLAFPVGVTVDAQGAIVVVDTLNQRIRRIGTDGMIATIAGTGTVGYGGDGGLASAAPIANAFGIASDDHGALALADTGNERIRRIAADGTIATVAGNGTFGFGGDGGNATSAELGNPFGVAVDAMSRVHIADTFDQRIRRVELDGTITTVAGTGIYGFSGDGGPANRAQLANPDGVTVDAMGRIYIADTYNHRIRRVEIDGTISTVAGDGQAIDGGDGGPATSAHLQNPNGVAVDSQGRLYIADTYNHRIRRVDGGTITTVAGNGAFGYGGDGAAATLATISFPYAVAVDAQDRVLFGDTTNNRIRRVETDGTITTIAGTGVAGFDGDGKQATATQISAPYGIAIDAQGRILFVDFGNQRIRRIATDGTVSTIAGTGVAGANGDAAAATSAQLAFPIGLAVDAQGRIAIADTNNQRIRSIDPTTQIITTIAGKIDPDDVGPVAKARLDDPQALAVSPQLVVVAGGASGTLEAIRDGRVVVVAGRYPQAVATGALARFQTDAFGSVGGAALDAAANAIYITERSANRIHRIDEVDPADPGTWTISTIANDDGTAGFADGTAATARFRAPSGLYLDAATHVLYIADTGNHAIRTLDLASGTVATVVNAGHSLGFSGDGGPATTALLFEPSAITRCGTDLFIADTGNNRVRRVTADQTISTVLGDGVAASSGEGTPARTFPVDAPLGLACDAFGDLFATSATTVRLLPANDSQVVDGSGAVQTIYGVPPRTTFPASVTNCLTGLAITSSTEVQVTDACTGLMVQLDRVPAAP